MHDELFLWIGGERLAGEGRDVHLVVNPATGEELGRLPLARATDLDRALESSREAFAIWRAVPSWDRARILRRAADIMRDRADQIARTMTLEQGKTLAESRLEVMISADIFEWCAEEAKRIYGRVVPSRGAGQRQLVVKEPVGPVAAFSPWNFPAITPARKIAAALASGCSIILKPAEETPGTALAMALALDEAGLPAGALNIVFGVPAEVSTHLIASPITRKLSFTGSTVVGRQLAALAAAGPKRSTLELGGHAPVLIFADANMQGLIDQAIAWKFRNAGQVCTSPTRFYIQDAVYDRFVTDLAEAARRLRVGNGLDAANQMGPLANGRRLQGVEQLCADAIGTGARLLAGGERCGDGGLFWSPTVIADVPDGARAMSEEPFGPIALCNRFSTLEDAIGKANRLPYGLAAYAFTRSADNAIALGDEIESGMIGINSFSVTSPETPFSGHKDSGYGSEGGTEGIEGYLQTKFINQVPA